MVTGSRQVGKSTLLEHLFPQVPLLSFDDMNLRIAAREDPAGFLQMNQPPLVLDEIQHAPELFPQIKLDVDRSKKKGQFYLPGSQSYRLMKQVTESLAGRVGIMQLHGLSLREIQGIDFREPFFPTDDYLSERRDSLIPLSIGQYWELIHRGSKPELTAHPSMDWAEFYSDYVTAYIERDVRDVTQVGDTRQFRQFMTALAAMTGQLLNLSSLARDISMSVPTMKRWLSILESSGHIYLLQPYGNNLIKRTVKTPKVYFLDTGLAAYLTRWDTPQSLSHGAMSGHYFETFVVAEVLKSYHNAGIEPALYFLRDHSGKEIDLLFFQNETLYPFEIKQTASPDRRLTKTFDVIESTPGVKRGPGGVICLAENLLPFGGDDRAIPLAYL